MKLKIYLCLLCLSLVFTACFTETEEKVIEEETTNIVKEKETPYMTYEEKYEWLEDHKEEKTDFIKYYSYSGEEAVLEFEYEFEYSASDLNTKVVEKDSEGNPKEYYQYTYNENRQPTQGQLYNAEGELLSYYTVTYNAQGMYTEIADYDAIGTLKARQTSTYDETGYNYLMESYYDEDNKVVEKYEISYETNTSGEAIYINEEELTKKWIKENHTIYTSVEIGNATESSITISAITMVYNYTWNKNNNMVLQSDIDEDGNLTEMRSYEYDDYGNNTREIYLVGSEVQSYEVYNYEDPTADYPVYSSMYQYSRNHNPELQNKYIFNYLEEEIEGKTMNTYKYDVYSYDTEVIKRNINKKTQNKLEKKPKTNFKLKR